MKKIELFYESMDEWDSVFDPTDKPEYSHDQLVRFAELWADNQLKEYKLINQKIK